MSRAGRKGAAAGLALALTLAGCTGDFGRPRPNVITDTIAPQIGFWAATWRGEQASWLKLTDEEERLRDRAWRFVMPAHEKSYFERAVSELAYTRILPVTAQSSDIGDYHRALLRSSFASQTSRYARLAEDAYADRVLLAPFRQEAARVIAADRSRLRVAEASPLVAPEIRDPAFDRVVENEGLILWVCERVTFRIESYRYSLSNLVVELPSREAVRAERSIMALEADAATLCKLPLIGVFKRGGAVAEALPGVRAPAVVKD